MSHFWRDIQTNSTDIHLSLAGHHPGTFGNLTFRFLNPSCVKVLLVLVVVRVVVELTVEVWVVLLVLKTAKTTFKISSLCGKKTKKNRHRQKEIEILGRIFPSSTFFIEAWVSPCYRDTLTVKRKSPGGGGGCCNGAGSCLWRSRAGCFSDTATAGDATGDARRHTRTCGKCEGAGSRSAPSKTSNWKWHLTILLCYTSTYTTWTYLDHLLSFSWFQRHLDHSKPA